MNKTGCDQVMIRLAGSGDVEAVAQGYTDLLMYEQQHGSNSNWQLGIYPTIQVADEAAAKGTLYILEEAGQVLASMILNREQAAEYQSIAWQWLALPAEVLVIHTLCVVPRAARRGCGRRMVEFAEELAERTGCRVIRIDTFAGNEPARTLYTKLGFRFAGMAQALLHGVISEELAFFELKIDS